MSNEDTLYADGFEKAYIGLGRRCCQIDIAVYDTAKCISILEEQGMDYDDAVDFYEFNVVGAWVGEGTPLFLDLEEKDEEEY